MKQRKSIWPSLLGFLARLFALIALGLLIVFARKFLVPSSIGMALGKVTISPTEVAPTSFQLWRETSEAAVMQTRLALIAMTTVTPPPTCCPPTLTQLPFATGIFEAHINPQPFANGWQGVVNEQQIRVFAGGVAGTYSNTPNLTKGFLKVQVFSHDLSNYESVWYETSELTGWLQVTSEDQYILTLVGQNGQTLYFDVRTMLFVDVLPVTVTAPTITPLPSITSTAIPPTPYPLP